MTAPTNRRAALRLLTAITEVRAVRSLLLRLGAPLGAGVAATLEETPWDELFVEERPRRVQSRRLRTTSSP